MTNILITYRFLLDETRVLEFPINLDRINLSFINTDKSELPNWTRLDYEPRCVNCSLRNKGELYCPVAVNLKAVVTLFKDLNSYEIIDCQVLTKERNYFKEDISIQAALSSLIGIIMTTSGCEHLDFLRPMVKFHLPFASIEETVYRAASMYTLAQYFRAKRDFNSDLSLSGLVDIYNNIDDVNAKLCRRLREATNKDASLNAVVVLDVFAKMIPMSIEETLKVFELLFSKFLED